MTLNLEEIKKRSEKTKTALSEYVDLKPHNLAWAADTILQLVAEVERLQDVEVDLRFKINRIQKSKNESVKYLNDKCDTFFKVNKKLTAANKIMRDYLRRSKKCNCVGAAGQIDHSPDCTKVNIEKAIAEADEAMK